MQKSIQTLCEQLVNALEAKLAGTFGEINELDMIRALQEPPYQLFSKDSLQSELSLFQTHFLLYHALYKLRDYWLKEEYAVVDILLSKFVIYPYENSPKELPALDDQLRTYYLTIENLEISEEDVEQLLTSFWARFLSEQSINSDAVSAAYQRLSLEKNCSDLMLRKQVKALCLKYHPDKGGDETLFREVQSAYELIKTARQRRS